jgi:hypothetical protein
MVILGEHVKCEDEVIAKHNVHREVVEDVKVTVDILPGVTKSPRGIMNDTRSEYF